MNTFRKVPKCRDPLIFLGTLQPYYAAGGKPSTWVTAGGTRRAELLFNESEISVFYSVTHTKQINFEITEN